MENKQRDVEDICRNSRPNLIEGCFRSSQWCFFSLWLLFGVGGSWAASEATLAKTESSWALFFGPFHTVILHYPIGFLTIVLLLEVYLMVRAQSELRKVLGWIVLLTALSAVTTATLGWLRAKGATYDPELLERHRWAGLAVAVLTTLMAVLYRKGFSKVAPPFWQTAYRVCLFGTFGVLVFAAHLGGSLTHGSNYLTENAPPVLRRFMGEKTKAADVTPSNGANSLFAATIAPIFEAKCVQCHGPEKQKGKFRLDSPEKLLFGGASGKPAVKPGDPLGSELIRLVTLPRDHEDAMPPEGKLALTPSEVVTLMQWIYGGAKFN